MKYKNIHAATQVTGMRLKELRESAGLTPTTLGKKSINIIIQYCILKMELQILP